MPQCVKLLSQREKGRTLSRPKGSNFNNTHENLSGMGLAPTRKAPRQCLVNILFEASVLIKLRSPHTNAESFNRAKPKKLITRARL